MTPGAKTRGGDGGANGDHHGDADGDGDGDEQDEEGEHDDDGAEHGEHRDDAHEADDEHDDDDTDDDKDDEHHGDGTRTTRGDQDEGCIGGADAANWNVRRGRRSQSDGSRCPVLTARRISSSLTAPLASDLFLPRCIFAHLLRGATKMRIQPASALASSLRHRPAGLANPPGKALRA